MLAITAAYFSVFGLSKLFIGAALSVIIMAGTLEFSKIIIVSFLHQYWKKLAKGLKAYLLLGTIILMIITSAGIYGFLSSAYSKVSTDLDKMSGNIELLDKKIEIKKEEKIRFDEQITTKTERIKTLFDLRKSQETRLDSLYQRGWAAAAKKTEIIISQADENIAKLNIEINDIGIKIENLNDSIAKYESAKLDLNGSEIAGEVGPLKYISKLTGADMDTVVNWLTLLLIIVFDPLAVALIISTSSMIKMIREERESKTIKDRDDTFRKKVKYVSDEHGNFKLEDTLPAEIPLEKSSSIKVPLIEEKKEEIPVVEEVSVVEETKEETPVIEEVPTVEEIKEEVSVIEEAKEESPIVEEVPVVEETKEVPVEESLPEEPIMQKVEKYSSQEIPVINIRRNTVVSNVFTAPTHNEIEEPEKIDVDKLKKQSLYLRLLEIFYANGTKKSGEEIPSYIDFKKMIDSELIDTNEKDIKDFLVICNLFKITEFKSGVGFFEKEYEDAFYLVSRI